MGEYAAAYTKGFQYQGGDQHTTKYLTGILTLKHYVANTVDNTVVNQSGRVDGQQYIAGTEINRHTMDVTISNAQLQEYHLVNYLGSHFLQIAHTQKDWIFHTILAD